MDPILSVKAAKIARVWWWPWSKMGGPTERLSNYRHFEWDYQLIGNIAQRIYANLNLNFGQVGHLASLNSAASLHSLRGHHRYTVPLQPLHSFDNTHQSSSLHTCSTKGITKAVITGLICHRELITWLILTTASRQTGFSLLDFASLHLESGRISRKT